MKTLSSPELQYMDSNESCVTLTNVSYNYVKSLLFGFKGWDKYILTEDEILKNYLMHLLAHDNHSIFSEYKIIYIGGGNNVVNLMGRNNDEEFFSSSNNVISVLDGDQKYLRYCRDNDKVFFIPFDSVEKQLKKHYDRANRDGLPFVELSDTPKRLYKSLIKTEKMSHSNIFSFINQRKNDEVQIFKNQLIDFLDA